MDKVGKADMRVTRGRGEIVPRDFAAAVKDIPKPYRSLAPVIEGVRRELANGLKERAKKI